MSAAVAIGEDPASASTDKGGNVEDAVAESKAEGNANGNEVDDGWASAQEPLLVHMLASELGIEPADLLDFECSLYDTQPAALGGANSEFLYSSRLDNLASCFVAVEALLSHSEAELATDSEVRCALIVHSITTHMSALAPNRSPTAPDSFHINPHHPSIEIPSSPLSHLSNSIHQTPSHIQVSIAALFDHEEVGSGSTSGAGSPIMGEAVRRVSTALNAGDG